MPKIKIEGVESIVEGLSKKCSLSAVQTIIRKNGDEMNKRMKRNTQSAFTRGYTTGETARSINTVIKDGGLTAKVEPTTKYAPYVEYGTRFMEAEPFVRPAFEEQVRHFKSDMEKLVR